MDVEFLPRDESATGCWVVVADSSRARIFETHRIAPGLRPALSCDLVGNRLLDRERWSDRAGVTHASAGHAVHAMAAPTSPADHSDDVLCHEVAQVLAKARTDHRLTSIVLVAAPRLLGRLRHALDRPTHDLVIAEEPHEISRLPEHELERRIPAVAWPQGVAPARRRT